MVLSSADIFFSKSVWLLLLLFFQKIKSFGNIIRVSSSLDPDRTRHLSCLIWVQIVCKGYQQTTRESKEFMPTVQANKRVDKKLRIEDIH